MLKRGVRCCWYDNGGGGANGDGGDGDPDGGGGGDECTLGGVRGYFGSDGGVII